jgi:hypothetical protein
MTSALSQRWTKRDEQLLAKLHAAGVPDDQIAARVRRTAVAVKSRRTVLGLVADRRWKPEHVEKVRKEFTTRKAKDIAAEIGKTDQEIYRLARRLGLQKLRHWSKRERAELAAFIRSKNKLGWSDAEISTEWNKRHAELTVSREWVMEVRREKLGLPSNAFSEHRRLTVAAKTREQLEKAGLPSIGHLRVEAYKAYCARVGWPQVSRPRLAQILNALYEQGPKTLPELAAAIGMRWRPSKHHPNGVGLTGNGPGGSYTGELTKLGLVVRLGRKARYATGKGKVRFIYAIAPGVVRGKVDVERKVS